MIYEFITPSDAITFLANDEKIAIATAIIMGNGKAGCHDETDKSLPTMYLFHKDPLSAIEKDLGEPLETFCDNHTEEIAECLKSFAYGSIDDRKQFDDAVAAITDPKKLKEFKDKHEDRNRSSMSEWVKGAWEMGDAMLKNKKQIA